MKFHYIKPTASLFVVLLIAYSCSNNETIKTEDKKIDYISSIKGINERLHQGIGDKSIESKDINHSYTFISKNGESLECYYELGYDSEGWPMAGNVYYFKEKQLIGYGYVPCDGCIGQDVSNKLMSLPIKHYQSEKDLKDWDVIWIIEKPNQELNAKTTEILKTFNSSQTNSANGESKSYGELRGRIIGGNLRMLERELGKPSYSDIAPEFIENNFQMKLPIGLFDKCLSYEVYVYENYLGDGQNILVIIDQNKKVSNVVLQNEVQDVEDICCCN